MHRPQASSASAAHAEMVMGTAARALQGPSSPLAELSLPFRKRGLLRSVQDGNGDSATGGRFRCQSQAVIGEDFSVVLAAAQRGDEGAFTILWRDGNPALLRYLKVIAPESAEDIAAETWVQVVRGLADFRGDERAWRAWLFTTSRRRTADEGRRRARRPAVPLEYIPESTLPGSADAADVALEHLGTQAALAMVRKLPQQQAEVILLRVVAGLDTEAVSRVLGRSAGAVRVATHRGLRRLAQRTADAGVTL